MKRLVLTTLRRRIDDRYTHKHFYVRERVYTNLFGHNERRQRVANIPAILSFDFRRLDIQEDITVPVIFTEEEEDIMDLP